MTMKLSLLDLGEITSDPGWFFEGAGAWMHSHGQPSKDTRRLKMIGAVIEHPKHGVILYEVGPAPKWSEIWPEPVREVFPITRYNEENRLDRQLEKAGYPVSDVSAVILGHMHLDHAGGLEFFRDTEVPIYVHEDELKYAWYAVATKEDFGPYLPHYIDASFNWKAIKRDEIELFDGITLYKTPGHTPGLMAMQVDLKEAGTFVFTSDTFFFSENYHNAHAPGWLTRDMLGWHYSLERIQNLHERRSASLVFGHDPDVFEHFAAEEQYD